MKTDSKIQTINSSLSVEHTHLEESLWAAGDPTYIYEKASPCFK